MLVKAEQKNVRTSPRKLALVAEAVRSLSPAEALVQLEFINKRAAGVLLKLFKQAMANAVNNSQLDPASLKIEILEVKKGATYKRFRPVSRGRAHPIKKRTSHVSLVLSGEKLTKAKPTQPTKPAKVAQPEPVEGKNVNKTKMTQPRVSKVTQAEPVEAKSQMSQRRKHGAKS